MTPRWTYTEANALKWKPVFDALISGNSASVQIPLADNAKSLTSLKVRVGDALKWLADQYRLAQVETFKPYADLKRRVRYNIAADSLIVKLRRGIAFHAGNEQVQPDESQRMTPDALERMLAMVRDTTRPTERRKAIAGVVLSELLQRKAAGDSVDELLGDAAMLVPSMLAQP